MYLQTVQMSQNNGIAVTDIIAKPRIHLYLFSLNLEVQFSLLCIEAKKKSHLERVVPT